MLNHRNTQRTTSIGRSHVHFFDPGPGQAIVLIALVLVVLLAITGLAVDGGSMYMTQRNTQNAVDAAVIAATFQLCSGGDLNDIQNAAYSAATANGCPNDGVTSTVTVNNPPTSGLATGDSSYVEIIIWADAPTYLIQTVYTGPTEVTVRAVGQCVLPRSIFSGYSLISLCGKDPHKTGISVDGGGNIVIFGGGAMSNSTNSTNGSISVNGTNTQFIAPDGSIDAAGEIVVTGAGATFGPDSQENVPVVADPLADLPEPPNPGNCQSVPTIHEGQNITLPPGCYTGIQMNGGTLTMQDGLYYFTGDVSITNGDLNATNVTIFQKSGGFQATGGSIIMRASTSGEWAGMLLYSARDNTGENDSIKLTAQSYLEIVGTIYAPGVDVELSGRTGDVVIAQIIADTVKVSGQGDFTIIYDDSYFYHLPPEIGMSE